LLARARHPLLSRTLLGQLAYKLQFALVTLIALLTLNGDRVRRRGFDRNVAQASAAEWRRRLQEITRHDRSGALQRGCGIGDRGSQNRASVI
jgi:hypothetical protein